MVKLISDNFLNECFFKKIEYINILASASINIYDCSLLQTRANQAKVSQKFWGMRRTKSVSKNTTRMQAYW